MTPWHFRAETETLDDAARSGMAGQFIALPDGVVHYESSGPPDGQPVVLVHGFSVPCYIWDPTVPALAQAGFRVLRYDLYGRGASDRPAVTYDRDLFDRQLENLMDALSITGPADLAGISMGGPIVANFTARHPERVRRLVLIDPAGFALKQSLAARLVTLPRLGEWVMDRFGDRILVSDLLHDFYQPERFPEYRSQYLPQMRYRGFRRALLSTLRSGIVTGNTDAYRQVGRQQRRALLLWGRDDKTIPFETHARVLGAMPGLEFHAIDEAGHAPHYEQPELVNRLIIEFLQTNEAEDG